MWAWVGVVAKSVFIQYLMYGWHDSDGTLKYRQTYRLSVPSKKIFGHSRVLSMLAGKTF